jgi:hypothetical protein
MLDFVISNSHKLIAVVAVLSGAVGWLCRAHRKEIQDRIILDVFSGSTIYTTLYILLILCFLDETRVGAAVVQQSDMLIVTFGGAFLYFVRDYIDTVIIGVHANVAPRDHDDPGRKGINGAD